MYMYSTVMCILYIQCYTQMHAVCVQYVLHMVTIVLHVHDYASVRMRKRGIR